MLARVREHWVERPLEQLLRRAPLVDVTLEPRPEAVSRRPAPSGPRGRLGVQVEQAAAEEERDRTALAQRERLADVYDALEGELLVLGAPGSGKTTALLALARELIARAEQDEAHPIPMLFQLATWAAKRGTLAEWLIDEMAQPGGYDVHRRVAEQWVGDERILPLLDGLDEVDLEHRAACVEAINAFRESRQYVPQMVVTSRAADYEVLRPVQLELRGAVLLEPLNDEQIATYLAAGGNRLAGLRRAIEQDGAIREMAASPLLLSIMLPVYEESAEPAPSGMPEGHHDELFAAYVQTMFARQGGDGPYSHDQTLHWLGWLAGTLTRQQQGTYYLERLQPDWLPTAAARRWYAALDRVGVGLIAALAFGSMSGLLLGLVAGWGIAAQGAQVLGLAGALVGALLGGQQESAAPGSSERRTEVGRALRGALLACLLLGLISGLVGGVSGALGAGVTGGLGTGLLAALAGGLVGALAGAMAGGPGVRPRRIAVVERVRWSPTAAARAALLGLVLGAGLGLLVGLVGVAVGVISAESRSMAVLLTTALFGLLSGLGFGLFGGFIPGEVDPTEWVMPGQGLRRSARRATLVGVGMTALGALGFGLLFFGIQGDWLFGVRAGLLIGPLLGLLATLAFGGYACLSHGALRLVLWRSGVMPLDHVRLLEYAAQCTFVYRVGGGYRFMHGLWQQYFARGAG